jgi:hypothetical protein
MNPKKQISAMIFFATIISFLDAQEPQFTRIDTGTLVEEVVRGRGMYPVDIDQDGDLDLYIGNSTGVTLTGGGSGKNRPNLLYRNERNGNFTKITEGILANKIYETNPGNNWGDFDNDGDWDLFNHGEIFVNDSFGYAEKVIQVSNKDEFCGTWIDYDGDSYLDIFTNVLLDQNYMYKNNGDGTFTNIQVGAPSTAGIGGSQSSAWADCDNDGDLDVFEANLCIGNTCGDGLVNNNLYINEGDGTFSMIESDSPIVSDAMGAGGGSWGDYDNDGDMDLYVVSLMSSVNMLYRNNGNLEFERDTIEPEEAYDKYSYGSTWGDFNNDGTLDLFVGVINGSVFGESKPFKENLLFMNQGDGTFTRVTTGNVISDGAQALAANDIDNDGDLDLVITHGNLAPPFLTYIYRNDGNENHWLNFTCEGTTSNRSAIGTRIRVKAKIRGNDEWMTRELTQENGLHACNGARLHFGLGDASLSDSVIIRWPSGLSDTMVNVPADQFYHAIESTALDIDFRATNYIQLIKPLYADSLDNINDSIQLDLSEHFSLVTGNVIPDIEGDTLTFSIRSNENPDVVVASIDPVSTLLTLKGGTASGTSNIEIITSAGFTRRMDQFTVTHTIIDLIDLKQPDPSLLIYPNPSNTLLTIETEFPRSNLIEISTMNGQSIYHAKMEGKTKQIDLSPFQHGVYIITVRSNDYLSTRKIIKL